MAKVSAIILAAGTSSRMGEENKLFLDLKGKPIIQWVMSGVLSSDADEVILVTSEISKDALIPLLDSKMRLIDNPEYKLGMTSSIQVGVKSANHKNGLMICLGDLPLIKSETFDQLITAFKTNSERIIVPKYQGQNGNPVIFPPSLTDAILNHLEPEGCKIIVQTNQDLVMYVDVDDEGILLDVDTPGEIEKLVARC